MRQTDNALRPVLVPALAACILAMLQACATLPPEGQHRYRHSPRDTHAINAAFLLYMPRSPVTRQLPLLVFLHGSGERGDDLELVKIHGPPKVLARGRDLPFLVASPQLPAGARWDSDAIKALIDRVGDMAPVDPSRIFVTGLSLGGHGTWRFGADYPGVAAALVPVAGRGDPATACALADTAVWAFHGARDDVVTVDGTTGMVTAIRDCGGEPRMTVYPEAGHDSWTATYDDPALYEWLAGQRLPGVSRR